MEHQSMDYEHWVKEEFATICDVFRNPEDKKRRLPGPIAFEYGHLVKLVKEGDLAGCCWKIDNLRVMIGNVLEAVDRRYTNRLGRNDHRQERPGYQITSRALDEIRNWRNNYGTGHGALVHNVATHFWDISKCIKAIEDILEVMTQEGFYIE